MSQMTHAKSRPLFITFLFSIFETLKRQVLYIKFKAPEFKTNKQCTKKKKALLRDTVYVGQKTDIRTRDHAEIQ